MGAPTSGMAAAGQTAEAAALLDAFKTIDPADRKNHEAVLDYWLSIRANRELPPLRDLDPLEISDAAPSSLLLELIGGGEDAEIRHCGERLKQGVEVDRIAHAPRPSLLSSVARKLAIVAVSRNFLAFEDEFLNNGQPSRCWVTLLPFSAAGAWVDYVYAFVSFGPGVTPSAEAEVQAAEQAVEATEPQPEPVEEPEAVIEAEPLVEAEAVETPEAIEPEVIEPEVIEEAEAVVEAEEVLELGEPIEEAAPVAEIADEPVAEAAPAPAAQQAAGLSFDPRAEASGFYGTKVVKVEPVMPAVPVAPKAKPEPVEPEVAEAPPVAPEPVEPVQQTEVAAEEQPQPVTSAVEGNLQSKLTDVRAKADEARAAKLRANVALYEGLGAAYDFALDAEDSPEEYLKLVEAKGLKIQLRAPMRPVVKLAFEGMCDDSTIAQLEAVLAWAIEQELPRGSLAKRIEEAGGIGPILSGEARAAA